MGDEQPKDVIWTAREALACAYCWAEFSKPEDTGQGSPEAYWLKITEKARNDCRRIANDRLLLAVARRQAVAVLPGASLRDAEVAALGVELSMRTPWRIRRVVDAVHKVFARREAPDA